MTEARKVERLWTRDFGLLFSANLVALIGHQVYAPVLPLYLTTRLGATLGQVGMLSTLYTVVDVTARLLGGYVQEVVGRKRMVLISLALTALIAFLFSAPAALAVLMVLRVVQAIPAALSSTTIHTMVSDVVPAARVGEGMSYYSLGTTVSIAIGPLLALGALGEDRYGLAFGVAGVAAVGALVLCSFLRVPAPRYKLQRLTAAALVEGRIGWLACATALIYAAFAAQGSFIALYGKELALVPTSWFFAIYGAGTVVSRAATGQLFDRYGPTPSIASSVTLLGAGLLLLGLCRSAAMFLLAGLVEGIGFGIYAPAAYAMTLNMVPVNRRGAANAFIVSSMMMGSGIGAAICGLLAEGYGYRAMYLAAGLSMIIPGVLFFAKVIPDYRQKMAVAARAAAVQRQ